MFIRFCLRALVYRKQRLLLAFSALAVAATLATVLSGIYGSVEHRLRDEFRSYGANVVAVPANGSTVPMALAQAAERQGAEAAPFLITAGRWHGRTIPVAGFLLDKSKSLTTYWHVSGTRDIGTDGCLAGESLAKALHLKIASQVVLQRFSCTVRGIVSTGAAEDEELLVPYAAAEAIAGVEGVASVVEIRVPAERLQAVRTELSSHYPGVELRTVRSVAGTENNVVFKLRASLLLLMFLILIITTLCVSSNFSELVMERSREIGILKALGGAERKIAAFFLSESAALAFVATLVGYVAGLLAAAFIGRRIFGGAFQLIPDWALFGGVMLVMLAVASIATAVAASRVWRIEPAAILRGE